MIFLRPSMLFFLFLKSDKVFKNETFVYFYWSIDLFSAILGIIKFMFFYYSATVSPFIDTAQGD